MLSLRLPLWSTLVSKIFKNKSYRTAEVSINRRHILATIRWAHFWHSRANARSEKILESPPKVDFGPPWSSGNATSSTSNQANLVSAYSISLPQSTSDTFGQIQDFHKFTQVRVHHIVVHFAMISRMMTKLNDKFGQPWQVKTRASDLFWCQWKYVWLQYICPIRHQQQKIPLFAHRNSRLAPKNLETLPGLALCAMNIAPKTNVILRLLYLGKIHSLFTSKLWDLLGPQQLLIKPNVGFVISQKPNQFHEHNVERKEALNCIVPQVQKEAFSDDIQSSICRVTFCVLPCLWSFFCFF